MTRTLSSVRKLAFFSVGLAVVGAFLTAIFVSPQLASTLGISTGAATAVVNFLNAYSSITFVITIVGVITGVGSMGSGIAATVLYLLKKYGKAKAAAF